MRHELVVGALLHDPPLLHHRDLIRVPDGGQSVRDHDRGPLVPLEQIVRGSLHHPLALVVQRRCCFVQQQH
eukprot:3168376-Rhodomonas_salina.2